MIGDIPSNVGDRVSRFLLPPVPHLAMHFLHESMEMHPPLLIDCQRLVEQVHQHGLAAPDTAPHVNAACRGALFPEDT